MHKLLFIFLLCLGCATPRTHSIFPLNFSAQKPKALISSSCNGINGIHEGGFACEEKEPRQADIFVKILPTPGRVVFSDGLQKKVTDFNWRETGFWIWKGKKIETTWVKLDVGELTSLYGDVPVAFDVIGYAKNGVIVNRGIIYHRICNDRDIPCSRLVVDFDCIGEIKNTYPGQLGFCNRMSGSSQKFRIPLKGPGYEIQKGASLYVRAGRSGWVHEHDFESKDFEAGEYKFKYSNVIDGPELFSFMIIQKEQGVLQEYHTQIILNGFSAKWTGVDKPHVYLTGSKNSRKVNFCLPVTADLMEIIEGKRREITTAGCVVWKEKVLKRVCAFAYDRESGDQTNQCINEKYQYTKVGI